MSCDGVAWPTESNHGNCDTRVHVAKAMRINSNRAAICKSLCVRERSLTAPRSVSPARMASPAVGDAMTHNLGEVEMLGTGILHVELDYEALGLTEGETIFLGGRWSPSRHMWGEAMVSGRHAGSQILPARLGAHKNSRFGSGNSKKAKIPRAAGKRRPTRTARGAGRGRSRR